MDYFIYSIIGKEICKETLAYYRGIDCDHEFKWHTGRNQKCQICVSHGQYNNLASYYKKVLPCTDIDGHISVSKLKNYIR